MKEDTGLKEALLQDALKEAVESIGIEYRTRVAQLLNRKDTHIEGLDLNHVLIVRLAKELEAKVEDIQAMYDKALELLSK